MVVRRLAAVMLLLLLCEDRYAYASRKGVLCRVYHHEGVARCLAFCGVVALSLVRAPS